MTYEVSKTRIYGNLLTTVIKTFKTKEEAETCAKRMNKEYGNTYYYRVTERG